MSALYQRGKVWWYYWYDTKGKKHGTSLKTGDKNVAIREQKLRDADFILNPVSPSEDHVLWSQFETEILSLYPEDRQTKTHLIYKYALKRFNAILKPMTVREITTKKVNQWVIEAGNQVGTTTLNLEFRHLKHAFEVAKTYKWIKENPFKTAQKPVVIKKEKRYLTEDEIQRLLDTTHQLRTEDVKLMALLFIGCGLRRLELATLTWDQVDLQGGWLLIRKTPRFTPKDHEERDVPLPKDLISPLILQKAKSEKKDLVFPSPFDGDVWDSGAINRLFNRLYTKAGIKDASGVHMLRHTFGSRNVRFRPINDVQKDMGHSDVKTTMGYIHTSKDNRKASQANVPALPQKPQLKVVEQ